MKITFLFIASIADSCLAMALAPVRTLVLIEPASAALPAYHPPRAPCRTSWLGNSL